MNTPGGGHAPVVTAAPVTVCPRRGGQRHIHRATMLRCTCGWHGGQISACSPGNGGGRVAHVAHRRHLARVLAGADDRPAVPWWLTVEQAVADAGRVHRGEKRRGAAG